eukprot:TRINITY_DN2970_c0_g1_i5.p1 TRINITY_DN2970_c0_g1~~TRINITY_DN2970_c0_g1_i5.p1  ORF type:complete len:470 (+),score=109.64 TRINITY_DN2970_c0_g1_i5:408-1817(+)
MAVWFMRRYLWSLTKTLEFLASRRIDLDIRPAFIKQLGEYEKRLKEKEMGPKTYDWDEVFEATNEFENEELLLRNTYLNAQTNSLFNTASTSTSRSKIKLTWVDSCPTNMPLSTVIGEETHDYVKEEFIATSRDNSRNIKKSLKIFASDPVKIYKKLFDFREKTKKKSSRKYPKVPKVEVNSNPKKRIIKIEVNLPQKKNTTLIEKIVQDKVKTLKKHRANTFPDSPLECNDGRDYSTVKPQPVDNDFSILKPLTNSKCNTDSYRQDAAQVKESEPVVRKKPLIIRKVETKKIDSSIRPSSVSIRNSSIKGSNKCVQQLAHSKNDKPKKHRRLKQTGSEKVLLSTRPNPMAQSTHTKLIKKKLIDNLCLRFSTTDNSILNPGKSKASLSTSYKANSQRSESLKAKKLKDPVPVTNKILVLKKSFTQQLKSSDSYRSIVLARENGMKSAKSMVNSTSEKAIPSIKLIWKS